MGRNKAVKDRFDREFALYYAMRADLEREHPGQWALIHQDEFVGAYPTALAAVQEGTQRFGENLYLVCKIDGAIRPIPIGHWAFISG